MAFVEDAKELQAKGYARPLKYTVDKAIPGEPRTFRYIFDQGALRCSASAEHQDRACYVPRGVPTTLAREGPSFVYVDVGCWVDNADGNGTRRRDFALICGAHVYLCEFVNTPLMPLTRIAAVRNFFASLSERGCGARVLQHALARDLNKKTSTDPNLYLLLGDLHMPPATWFYSRSDIAFPPPHELPDWLAKAPAMARQPDYLLHGYYDRAATDRENNQVPEAHDPNYQSNPDIFAQAGTDLVRFLAALAQLSQEVKQRLHFIQTGDMFELWVGRDYQFIPGKNGAPTWIDVSAPNRVADWALEILVQNTPVFAMLRRLELAGLAEVKYLGGNHDGYLTRPELTSQLGLPRRDLIYRGLSGDLLVEHGHRFDGWNFDKVKGQHLVSGPGLTKWLLYDPDIRNLEPLGGYISVFNNPGTRDVYLLGATLAYLFERFHAQQKPFSIYAMGHTHAQMMLRFDVRANYTGSYHEEATEGEMQP